MESELQTSTKEALVVAVATVATCGQQAEVKTSDNPIEVGAGDTAALSTTSDATTLHDDSNTCPDGLHAVECAEKDGSLVGCEGSGSEVSEVHNDLITTSTIDVATVHEAVSDVMPAVVLVDKALVGFDDSETVADVSTTSSADVSTLHDKVLNISDEVHAVELVNKSLSSVVSEASFVHADSTTTSPSKVRFTVRLPSVQPLRTDSMSDTHSGPSNMPKRSEDGCNEAQKKLFVFPFWAKSPWFTDIASRSHVETFGDANFYYMQPPTKNEVPARAEIVNCMRVEVEKFMIDNDVFTCYLVNGKVIKTNKHLIARDLNYTVAASNFIVLGSDKLVDKHAFHLQDFRSFFKRIRKFTVKGLFQAVTLWELFDQLNKDVVIDIDMFGVQFHMTGQLRKIAESMPYIGNLKYNGIGTDSPHGSDVLRHVKKVFMCMHQQPFVSVSVIVADLPMFRMLKLFLKDVCEIVSTRFTMFVVKPLDHDAKLVLEMSDFRFAGVEIRKPLLYELDFVVYYLYKEGVHIEFVFPK